MVADFLLYSLRNVGVWLALGVTALSCPSYAAQQGETVVLLHGLARSSSSMQTMQHALTSAGYTVCNIDYPSREYTVEQLAENYVLPRIRSCLAGVNTDAAAGFRLHFVTHSMGAIVVRQLEQTHPELTLGRVVMLAPPNQGSQVVDKIGDWLPFRWLNGPAGAQLSTQPTALPQRLGATHAQVGVVAGSRSINGILSLLIPGRDDGKVAISHTRLAGMRDFVVLPVSHPFIMKNPEVIRQTLQFLRTGSFTH